MSYLIDTNVISEVRKGKRCDANVSRWWATVDDDELYLSVLVVGEIRHGIERARRRDAEKAQALEMWLNKTKEAFKGRFLDITGPVAEEWGRMNAIRSLPTVDSLLAATAKVHELTLVTRNVRDIAETGAKVLDPFN